jgi:hypothetical protein
MTRHQPALESLIAQCEAFNFDCRIGGRVAVNIDGSDKPLITTTRTAAQVLSGHTAVVWLNDVRGCYSLSQVTPIPDAHAWAIYAENGNVRMWSYRREPVERVALSCGGKVVPYTPQPEPAWSSSAPENQGEHWHWTGDPDSAPTVITVMWSGSARKCFVPMNQSHSGEAIMCDVYGGYWKRIRRPEIPR